MKNHSCFFCNERKLLDWKLVYTILFHRCSLLSFQWPYFCYPLFISEMRANENGCRSKKKKMYGTIEGRKKKRKDWRKTCRWNFYHKVLFFFIFCNGFIWVVRLPFKAASDWYLKLKNKMEKTRTGTNKWTHSHTQNLLKARYSAMNRQAKWNKLKCN